MKALVFLFLLLMCNLTYSSCISSSVSTAVQVSKEANEARQLIGSGRVMDKKKAALIEQLKMEQDSIKVEPEKSPKLPPSNAIAHDFESFL